MLFNRIVSKEMHDWPKKYRKEKRVQQTSYLRVIASANNNKFMI